MRRHTRVLSRAAERTIAHAVELILGAAPEAAEIWFHGSRSRGDHRPDSDWDFLVVIPDEIAQQDHERAMTALRLLPDHLDAQTVGAAAFRGDSYGGPSYWARQEGRRVWP